MLPGLGESQVVGEGRGECSRTPHSIWKVMRYRGLVSPPRLVEANEGFQTITLLSDLCLKSLFWLLCGARVEVTIADE